MLNDGLPSQICMQCVQHINRAYSFRQLCERSENALRELFGRPIQPTFLELKPLIAETLISNPLPEIITSVAEPFQNAIPLGETFTITQNINPLPNSLNNTSEDIANVIANDIVNTVDNVQNIVTKSLNRDTNDFINTTQNTNTKAKLCSDKHCNDEKEIVDSTPKNLVQYKDSQNENDSSK